MPPPVSSSGRITLHVEGQLMLYTFQLPRMQMTRANLGVHVLFGEDRRLRRSIILAHEVSFEAQFDQNPNSFSTMLGHFHLRSPSSPPKLRRRNDVTYQARA